MRKRKDIHDPIHLKNNFIRPMINQPICIIRYEIISKKTRLSNKPGQEKADCNKLCQEIISREDKSMFQLGHSEVGFTLKCLAYLRF